MKVVCDKDQGKVGWSVGVRTRKAEAWLNNILLCKMKVMTEDVKGGGVSKILPPAFEPDKGTKAMNFFS